MGSPQGGDVGWGLGQGPSVLDFGLSFRGSLVYKELVPWFTRHSFLPYMWHWCGAAIPVIICCRAHETGTCGCMKKDISSIL